MSILADLAKRGMTVNTKPYDRYYFDISEEEAKEPLGLMQPMAHSAFTTETSYCGWKDYGIPCTYIKCLKDKAVTAQLWDRYIGMMQDANVDLTIEELNTGHSPFWTNPDELVELLVKVISPA